LSWVLADAAQRERLLAGFRSFAGRPQTLYLEAAPPTDLRPQLAAAGVHLAFSSAQHYFAVEVRVPDGRTLTSLVEGMPHSLLPPDAAALQSRPMLLAQGLAARLEQVSEKRNVRAVFDVLLTHPAALLARADAQGQMPVMTFPGESESLLPIYVDMASCQRAIEETNQKNAAMAMALFEPRKLFDLARNLQTGIAIGWYGGGENTIRYVPIRKIDLEILCNGALPRQYSVRDHMRMFCGMKPRGERAS
jgi:hypothetical protein